MTRLALLVFLIPVLPVNAQPRGFNYDESKVPDYALPELLEMEDGTPVETVDDWRTKRRPELVRLFEEHVYGRAPKGTVEDVEYDVREALDGKATRKQIRLHVAAGGESTTTIDLLIYLPREAEEPVPVFLALNFRGNHTIHPDPWINITHRWVPNDTGARNNRATAEGRGARSSRWPVEAILGRGFGLATIYCGDIDPDHDDGFENGVHALVPREAGAKPKPDDWGTIAAWAWGLSRAMDYLETDEEVDSDRVAVLGHSRLGKTALWAGARDERFALVVSNNSGCGGAALSRRAFGETVERINTSFPHWFCDRFTEYDDNEAACPVDQHQLIALMAPRPVYVASATGDQWADPRGEFLAAEHASPAFELFGRAGVSADEQPPPDTPVTGGWIGYHLRSGKHDLTEYDWQRYMDFFEKTVR